MCPILVHLSRQSCEILRNAMEQFDYARACPMAPHRHSLRALRREPCAEWTSRSALSGTECDLGRT
jgi:hypothetical protein